MTDTVNWLYLLASFAQTADLAISSTNDSMLSVYL